MKKTSKTLFKVVGIIAAVGLLLVIVSLAMGADFREAQIEMTGSFKTDDVKLVSREVRLSPEQVRGLELEIGSGEVEIAVSEEKEISIFHNGGFRDYEASLDNGIYEIEASAGKRNVMGNGSHEHKITILVPREMMLDSLEVSLGAGSVKTDGLTVEHLSAEVGAGAFQYEGSILGNASLECGAGEMCLHLQGKPEGYNYKLACGIGELMVNEEIYSGLAGIHEISNGVSNTIELECGVGKIELNIEE